jgi:hypothetical protein
MIEPMKPVQCIDWSQVEFMRVTLEKPWRGSGGLRFRCGNSAARKNLNFNAHDRKSRPYDPGQPIMFPRDKAVQVGESFIMPANTTRTMQTRNGEDVLDPTAHPAMTAFGWFGAPSEEGDVVGFTLSTERERICAFWGGYKLGPGDGTMHPPQVRIGPPDMPHVLLTPLDINQQPFEVDGKPLTIRPREFFYFDDPSQYTAQPEREAAPAGASSEVAELRARVEALTALLEVKPRGKEHQKANL